VTDFLKPLTLAEWDDRYAELPVQQIGHCGWVSLRKFFEEGNSRLATLRFDGSSAALILWNLLLSEEDRLHQARREGKRIIGTMKDLGTVPVMVYSFPDLVAFYPDGAWWIPCLQEAHEDVLSTADALGIDDSFCPVRSMLGAFESGTHFPVPDLFVCSAGAVCDDFSAIAQRLTDLGHPVAWWEIPSRRALEPDEEGVPLPGGLLSPRSHVDLVISEFQRIQGLLEGISEYRLTDLLLAEGIAAANRVRKLLAELRLLVFTAKGCPLPALEMLIAEMFAIHYCSDREAAESVLQGLLDEVRWRVENGKSVLPGQPAKVFWVNPPADLYAMNLLEECGGRLCGTDFLIMHALDEIPKDAPSLEALARTALADPMVGPSHDRAARIVHDARRFGAEGVIISRIPGASHCATEGIAIAKAIEDAMGLPVVEIEVPPVLDSMKLTLQNRMQALIEAITARRQG
jgi:benzoyl-CoA reductase/2-hydroxyglutaryl-CoA dehydratase subunit BcrC/BadD/HgdB